MEKAFETFLPSQYNPAQQTAAAAVAVWYIDPQHGSDANPGTTQGAPIRTFAERARRLGGMAPTVSQSIYLLSSQPDTTDPFRGDVWIGANVGMVSGELGKTLLLTRGAGAGAIGQAMPSTNTPWTITDTGVNWSTYLFARIRWTSGAASGCTSWVMKDLGSGVARITPPTLLVTTLPSALSPWPSATFATPAAGDAYVVESLPQLQSIVPGWNSATLSAAGIALIFVSISFDSLTGSGFFNDVAIPNQAGGPSVGFSGCALSYVCGTYVAYGCLHAGTGFSADNPQIWGFGMVGGPTIIAGSRVYLNTGLVENAPNSPGFGGTGGFDVAAGGTLYVNDVGMFDTTGAAILVEYAGALQADTGGLWGSGNSTYGVQVNLGGQALCSAVPTITGTDGNLLDGADAHSWSTLGSAPFLVGPRPWSATGNVNLNGSTPVTVNVSGMLSTDTVSVTCTASGGTRSLVPIIARSNGSFTVTGVAGDTSTYAYSVQRLG